VKKNPIATKRALRAILKANDICAEDPQRAMQSLLDNKVREIKEKQYMLDSLKAIPYGKWREYNPEETIRFYTLRLRDNGMIKMGPEEFIERHTNWSHLRSMKKELALNW
jgi:NitT/TauT family transport system substrate-binding protein